MATISISDGKIVEGALPGKGLEMVNEWVSQHKEDLLTMWENSGSQTAFSIGIRKEIYVS